MSKYYAMKKITILSLFCLLFSLASYSQDIKEGVYTNDNTFLCIYNDTIFYNWEHFWYLGPYEFEDGKYYFGKNTLLGMNAFVEKEPCSPDSIEIKMICKYQHIYFDSPIEDSTIYEGESDFYYILINDWIFESRNKKGINIPKEQLSKEELSIGFLIEGGMLSGFQDYFDFPLEYGTRYIIKQKYYQSFHPWLSIGDNKDYLKIKFENKGKELWYKTSNPNCDRYIKLNYVSPNVDSCFNEFKNRFPLLFE